jgi:hypothetical protein
MGDGSVSTTVLVGTNEITDCRTLVTLREHPLLRVSFAPLRVSLSTPPDLGTQAHVEENEPRSPLAPGLQVVADARTVVILLGDAPLVFAVEIDPSTVRLKLDLRPLGIWLFDDVDGLHVGASVVAGSSILGCETAITLT